MGYADGEAGKTGGIGEAEADRFLLQHGFVAVRPPGRDIGIDRIITSAKWPGVHVTAQIKGRRQIANPRWFQVTITAAQIQAAREERGKLDHLWKDRILMVHFWLLVSVPKNEVWVLPSDKVLEIAKLNTPQYITRKDNQFEMPHYRKNGKMAGKHKELNLDIHVNGNPLWQGFVEYRNEVAALCSFFAEQSKKALRSRQQHS